MLVKTATENNTEIIIIIIKGIYIAQVRKGHKCHKLFQNGEIVPHLIFPELFD